MSGIVGVFNRNGEPVRRETIVSMCDAINHRGPHGRGIWTDGPVGFGHVLLHTTEESLREEQPFSLDRKVWITADARIDDRDGLIDLLKSKIHSGVDLHEETDVALLLHAYHAWGVECVNHLIGVFAAAIWDGREHQLVCLRDQIGVKPFYYAYVSTHVVFASEVKGILASGLVPQRIYEPRIADYLVNPLEGIDKICTFFERIDRLPPAHSLVTGPHKSRVEQYWKLDPAKEIRFKDHREYIEAFRELFYGSVRARLRGVQPVASMLSGGLDSSSIVAVARDILKQDNKPDLPTFSMVNTKDRNCAETYFINQVLLQKGLEPCLIEVEDTAKSRDELLWETRITDELFDFSLHVPQIMYSEAHRHGLTAMCDGVDGHLGLGQPGNHVAYLLQAFKFQAAIHEARCTSRFFHQFSGNLWTEIYRAVRTAYTPVLLRRVRDHYKLLTKGHTIHNLIKDSIIKKDFAIKVDLLKRFETLRSHGNKSKKNNMRLNHFNALTHPFLVVALERYDRVASQYSIEPRHPILDKRLVEFCLALPWEQKICNGWTKMIARKSMEGLLPEEVVWRRGWEHLGPQVTGKLMSLNKVETQNSILEESGNISKYVDRSKLLNFCHSFMNSKGATDSLEWKIINAIALIKWLKWWK